jgi:hypothetical protein
MAVEDVCTRNLWLWVRLCEKCGKRHAMPYHHNLEEYLTAYLDGAGLSDDPKGPLFRTGDLTRTVLPQVCDDPPARRSSRDQGRSCCSGRCRLSYDQRSFANANSNGKVAPVPAVRRTVAKTANVASTVTGLAEKKAAWAGRGRRLDPNAVERNPLGSAIL